MILEAAAQVFQREGLDATTNRIAERAGVSIGSLYQYFPNKHALLYALAEYHLGEVETSLRAVFAELHRAAPPWPDTVRALVEAIVALHAKRSFVQKLMYEHAPRTEEGLARLQRLLEYASAEIAQHLRRCSRGGPDHGLSAALLVHAVDAQLHRVVLEPPDGRSFEECVAAVIALWSSLGQDG